MSERTFDQKFGEGLLSAVPTGAGVYRYMNADGVVIYVGKARNLRRRLQNYRSAGRKRGHRKMVRIVKAASSLSYEEVATEEAALLLENQLISELKPQLNVDGAFAFLYPAIGVGETEKDILLCFTTQPEAYEPHGLTWHGTFRSRLRAKTAFDVLVGLLSLIGHRAKRGALPPHAALKGSRLLGLRQVPPDLAESLPRFFAGEDRTFLSALAVSLLSKPRARSRAAEVQEKLALLRYFFEKDAEPLRRALRLFGKTGSYVPQEERDSLFIRAQFGSES